MRLEERLCPAGGKLLRRRDRPRSLLLQRGKLVEQGVHDGLRLALTARDATYVRGIDIEACGYPTVQSKVPLVEAE
jgi:hypothetical protein